MEADLGTVAWYVAGIFALGGITLLFWFGFWYGRLRRFSMRRAAATERRDDLLRAAKNDGS